MSGGIQKLFSEVHGTYELVNHVLTFGLDILWRRSAAREAARDGGSMWMDICSGTGEMAVNLRRLAGEDAMVTAADFSLPMLGRAAGKQEARGIRFVIADVTALPFPGDTFDLVTISFATRNINTGRDALLHVFGEVRRVLKPGGRFIILETSQPPSRAFRKLFHTYVGLAVKPLGFLISGSKAGYAYLAHTIPRFYNAAELAALLREAGFGTVDYRTMMFGAVAVHRAVK